MSSSSSSEPEWNVAFAPFYPFAISMTLPIVSQFVVASTRLPYFAKINDKVGLPNPPALVTQHVSSNTFWRCSFGSVCTTIGWLFITKSMDHMSSDDNILATDGVWAYTRNPIYFGSILMQIGASLLADNGVIALSIVPYFLWLQFYVLPIEEAGLIKFFGDQYKKYMRKTKRWILF